MFSYSSLASRGVAPTFSGGGGDPPPDGEITHGRQINASNTGHLAYFDPGLDRNVQDSDLTLVTTTPWASDMFTEGQVIEKYFFENGIVMDLENLTFRACKFMGGVSGRDPVDGDLYHNFTLEWCTVFTEGYTVDPDTTGAEAIRTGNCTVYRCNLGGCSDGVRMSNSIVTECYIRTKGMAVDDHNDGAQAYLGTTSTIQRCNIDCRPVNGIGDPNAALFAADNSDGLMTWNDNWCAGGEYVIRCNEKNCTYEIQGNEIFLGPQSVNPATRGLDPPPQSALNWGTIRPNVIVDASGNVLSTVAKP